MTCDIYRKSLFEIPKGLIYLDGNSLGPLPRGAADRLQRTARDEWGQMLIGAWNSAGWMDQPAQLGDRIAPLIGAHPGTVMVGETLSIRIYQLLDAALRLRPDRKVILSDTGNFPSDLYVASGLITQLQTGHELTLAEPDALIAAITSEVAVVMLTDVDYRTSRRHEMDRITAAAHDAGALVVWDLAHSAGALPVDLAGCQTDFAAGCSYKYLNGGPGAPAFAYVAPGLAERITPALSGWLGHRAPFDFGLDYRPAAGAARLRIGTPPVLQMAALDAALDVFDGISMDAVFARSRTLSERFQSLIAQHCPQLVLASPAASEDRGSHLSYRHPQGYAIIQALIARGVVGDFRAPDILRFGITPLYLDEADIDQAVAVCAQVLEKRLWDDPTYLARQPVT